jgi:hypothetical protein
MFGGSSEVTCVWCPAQCLAHGKHYQMLAVINIMVRLLQCVCALCASGVLHIFCYLCFSVHVYTHMCMHKYLSLYMPVSACLCLCVSG